MRTSGRPADARTLQDAPELPSGQACRSLLAAVALGLVALAITGTAGSAQSCGTRVLDDWRDGRLDGTYPVSCYRQALKHLPEDVQLKIAIGNAERVYSFQPADPATIAV